MRRENEFLYSQLANILREQIWSGFIKPGQYLMSENELCKYYGMSRTSVRKSLEQLAKEGLVIKRVGQGTIVAPDLKIPESKQKVLRILATSPSHYIEHCMPYVLEEFKRRYPNVEVKLLNFPTPDFWESVRASSELGMKPDLFFVTNRQLAELENPELVLDLSDVLKDSLPSIYPKLIEAFRTGDRLTAAPVTFSTVYLAYNPQLFERYGVPAPTANWTREDFMRTARQLTLDTDGDGIVDQYGFSLSSSISRWPVIAMQNGVFFNEETTKEGLLRTLQFLHDILFRNRSASLYQFSRLLNSEAFAMQKAAMILATSIELAGLRSLPLPFEPLVAPLPFGECKSTLLVSNSLLIPADAGDKELAVEFLKTVYSAELQEQVGRSTGFLSVFEPVNRKLWDKSYLESLNMTGDQINHSYFLHELFADYNLIEELEAEMEMFWAGMESASSFAARLYEMIKTRDHEL
ncbi:Uncharacterized HTH-type transcriptional regulator yurK [Chlamydia abortus]|uniref:Extracellular solute-binding protein n=1 Tax=Paenibacillus residui TaxID=629724 RepID=A0ABW3D2I9_9BACL|nr:extracellular solute-binding protein [Paenibacillus sp. 32O-W]SHE11613.1 Uncharacterized HTH-type transcriptional regulator yurK [Chlamydia abortus]